MGPRHSRLSAFLLATSAALFAVPAFVPAEVNAWAAATPPRRHGPETPLLAVDPVRAGTVYAVYQFGTYRSFDGGRTWHRLGTFSAPTFSGYMNSLLVSPTRPDYLLASGVRDNSGPGIFESSDGGSTWRLILRRRSFSTFAFSPATPSTLFAGTWIGGVTVSEDSGASWHDRSSLGVAKAIARLVLDPRSPSTVYAAGGADFEYPSEYPSSYPPSLILGKSTDAGATWTDLATALPRWASAEALVVSAGSPSTLFVGLADRSGARLPASPVLRSTDGGANWASASAGLPSRTNVFGLVEAPGRPGTLVAATSSGLYRTTDGGATWDHFGQQLRGAAADSLVLADRTLYAGTPGGAFALDLRSGAVDVASGADDVRVLSWDDDRLSVRVLGPSGDWSDTPPEGPFAAWTATAIAAGADGLSRVLWQGGDGRVGLEILGTDGSRAAYRFAAVNDWTASDVSVGTNGTAHLLWTSVRGQMFIASVDAAGLATNGPKYGPYTDWMPVALADGSDGATWVLWRHVSGRSSVARMREAVMESVRNFDAMAGWAARDVSVGADGRPRVLFTNPDGRVQVFTVDPAGALMSGQIHANPEFEGLRIASGGGLTRLLWNAPDGTASVWLLNPDNSLADKHAVPLRP